MKGIIFTTFNRLVEEKFGLEIWDRMIESVQPESEGIYVSTSTYSFQELINLVQDLSKETEVPVNDLIRVFGEYVFPFLANSQPQLVDSKTAKEFLLKVNDIVHFEVRKLYPDAELPLFDYEDPGDGKLVMIYSSIRNLPTFVEGLIIGVGLYFSEKISQNISVSKDVKAGNQLHRFELSFEKV